MMAAPKVNQAFALQVFSIVSIDSGPRLELMVGPFAKSSELSYFLCFFYHGVDESGHDGGDRGDE